MSLYAILLLPREGTELSQRGATPGTNFVSDTLLLGLAADFPKDCALRIRQQTGCTTIRPDFFGIALKKLQTIKKAPPNVIHDLLHM